MPQHIDELLPPAVPSLTPSTAANGHQTNGHSTNGFATTSAAVPSTSTSAVKARLDAMDYENSDAPGASPSALFKPLWAGSTIDRREFVRLALQTFKDMGYT
jgi:WD repeat-containing protein 26